MVKSSSSSSPHKYHPQPQHYEKAEDEDEDQYHHDDGPTNRNVPNTTTTTTTTSNRTITYNGGGKTTVMVIFFISIIMIFNSILLLYQYHLSTTFAMPSATNATNIIETLQSSSSSSSSSSSMIPTLTSSTLQQHCSSMMMMNENAMKSSSSSSSSSPTHHHHHHHQRRIMHTTMDNSMEEDHEEDTNTTMMSKMTSMSITSASSSTSSIFLWHVSIEMSITILTNLIHAALFLVVGIIVYLRHDVIWMLYMYHTTLFWTIITICSLVVYSRKPILALFYDSTQSPLLFYIQYCTIWLFGICSMIVWYRYRPTYLTTFHNAWNQHVTRNTNRHYYYYCCCCTTTTAIRIIYFGCQFLQYGMIGYYFITTLQYIIYNEAHSNSTINDDCHHDRSLHDVSDHNDEMIMMSSWEDSNSNMTTISQTTTSSSIDMNDFVMSYSEVAHLTFILSLLQLSVVYPFSNTCCIGTALVAGWKLLLNAISLSSLLQSISLSSSLWTLRSNLSLFYTIYDIVIMIPILLAALYLYYSNNNVLSGPERNGKGNRTKFTRLDDTASTADDSSSSTTSMNDDVNFVSLGVDTATKADRDDDHDNHCVEDGIMKVDDSTTTKQPMTEDESHDSSDHIATFACRTTFQIASPSSSTSFPKHQQPTYTWRQQCGAKLLSYGSLVLLIGMTLESIVLQSQSFLYVNHAKYDIYKWGLHLCVMFTFCTVMSMNVGVTYYEQYSRRILLLACPAGSLIAAYQCYNLWNGNDHMDIMSILVLLLFLIRCICGIIQTIGVYLLNTIQQQQYHCATTVSITSSSSEDDSSNSSSASSSDDDEELHIIDIGDNTTTVANFITNHQVSLTQQQRSRQEQLRELRTRINILFYYLFIPIMIVYIAMSIGGHYRHGHNDDEANDMCLIEPNISPMIPSTMTMSSSCSDNTTSSSNMDGAKSDFMLMPNIPGLGLYFHFGLVLLLFIYDGIQRTVPTYTPSLFLATLSTYHLAIVLVTDIVVWDVLQTQFYTTISLTNREILQRLVQFVWSLISGYLAYSLHQFWNMRVTALHE